MLNQKAIEYHCRFPSLAQTGSKLKKIIDSYKQHKDDKENLDKKVMKILIFLRQYEPEPSSTDNK